MANDKRIFNWQLFVGLVLVVTGGLFLADQLLDIRIMDYFWPLLVLLFGLTFFIGMLTAGKRGAGLAIPGAVISSLGVLLFIQNSFNLWITWAYAWTLLISAVGLGLLIMNSYIKRESLRRAGGLVIGIGLVLFVAFGLLFEVILNIAGATTASGIFLSAGLILLGIFVVFSRPLFARKTLAEPEQVTEAEAIDVLFSENAESPVEDNERTKVLPEGTEFTSLVFKSVGEVFLVQGDSCDLLIEGDPDLIKRVRTQVQDGELKITYDLDISNWKDFQWVNAENRLRYTVTVKDLDYVQLGGAGMLRAEQLRGDQLKVHHAGLGVLNVKDLQCQALTVTLGGLGEIRFVGEVDSQVVELSGGGSYQAANLHSRTAEVVLTGAGSAQVWVDEALTARISGAGNILFKGEPKIDQTITGLGSVKPL
jgi:hypothetical protein